MASTALKRAAPTIPTFPDPATLASSSLGQVAKSKFPNFVPRTTFPVAESLPKSYFLGHHKSGLEKMKHLLGTIDLVVECRDYRVPLTGRNELFERELFGLPDTARNSRGGLSPRGVKQRVIVFTKWDLGSDNPHAPQNKSRDDFLRKTNHPTPVHFSNTTNPRGSRRSHRPPKDKPETVAPRTTNALLNIFKQFARDNFSLTGHRVLVAGMPNVGKSTLLNALRAAGLPGRTKGKVAKTGAEPGVTRKVGTGVKILEVRDCLAASSESAGAPAGAPAPTSVDKTAPRAAVGEGVYLLDTPGVFMPYVPSALSMLKLALVGAVRDSLVDHVTLADFLLFNINLRGDPGVYAAYTNGEPTNDVGVLLEGVARTTGRLKKLRKEDVTAADLAAGVRKGQVEIDWEGAAAWLLQRWRAGAMGRFVLDDVEAAHGEEMMKGLVPDGGDVNISVSQAKKMEKQRRRETTARSRRSEP